MSIENGNGIGSLKFWQLLEQAEKLTQKNLPLAIVLKILEAIELPHKSEYSSSEAQKFLEAYNLMASQTISSADLKTIFLAKQVVSHIEDDTQKKTQDLASDVGLAMASKQEQLGTLWLELLEMRLNQWSESGLIEAAAHELRTRILKAEAGGISLNSVLLDWEANREAIMQKLLVELQTQKKSRRPQLG
jgi:hypothetical protein